MFLILYVVFVVAFPLGKGIPHFPVYLFMGIVLWSFFADMTQQSLGSIVGRGDLIRKVYIPRWTIVLSSSIAALINLGLNLLVLAVFMVINDVDLSSTIVFFPFIILEIYAFALGVSLFLSAAFVKFRDITYIWEVLLQAGFYITPILYPLNDKIAIGFQKLILLNPMAESIQSARYAVISHDPSVVTTSRVFDNGWYSLIPVVVVAITLLCGVIYFRSQSSSFAENM